MNLVFEARKSHFSHGALDAIHFECNKYRFSLYSGKITFFPYNLRNYSGQIEQDFFKVI